MSNFEILTNAEIDERVGCLAKSERKLTHQVLLHVAEVQRRKLYLDFGLTSVFQYLTKRHGYCESSAYLRIDAAKILARNPQLQEKVEVGSLKLSQLAKVQKCVRQKTRADKVASSPNQNGMLSESELFVQLENQSTFATDKILAEEFDFKCKQIQKVIPHAGNIVELTVFVSAEEFDEIKTSQSLFSHSVPSADLGKLFAFLAKAKNQSLRGKNAEPSEFSRSKQFKSPRKETGCSKSKSDFTERALGISDSEDEVPKDGSNYAKLAFEDTFGKAEFSKADVATQSSSARGFSKKRKYISLKIRRSLFAEAGHCCEFVDPLTGARCDSHYQLQVDHIIPKAVGGSDCASNLRVLCEVHNRERGRKNVRNFGRSVHDLI